MALLPRPIGAVTTSLNRFFVQRANNQISFSPMPYGSISDADALLLAALLVRAADRTHDYGAFHSIMLSLDQPGSRPVMR